MPDHSQPIGPITQAILNALWKRLWDTSPGNELYLPNIIKNGSTSLGLPSYDPAHYADKTDRLPVPGIPGDVSDQACSRDVPISPIATSPPNLAFANLQFTGLSFISPVPAASPTLTYSDTDATFVAVVSVGTSDKKFVTTAWDEAQSNYLFDIACCEPTEIGSTQCSDHTWTADAQGKFTASAYDVQLTLDIKLNTPKNGPLSITIRCIEVNIPSADIEICFDIDRQPEWVQQTAQMAVNEGVASNVLTQEIQAFLNSDPVKGDIEKLVNDQLAKLSD